jgi:hypothetical protein
MRAKDILEEQLIVRKGRLNGFGFEPAFNSYFDFYLDARYFGEPLLELQDVTFHLYLRKNLNTQNPRWKMPTVRQIMAKFRIGQSKVYGMLDRLEKAHLLNKESGVKPGTINKRNEYVLSDPIATIAEFLAVASAGLFRFPLEPSFAPCIRNEYTDVSETNTPACIQNGYDQQTLIPNQTCDSDEDKLWLNCLKQLQQQVTADTYMTFLSDTSYQGVIDGIAVITTSRSYAKGYLENRMGSLIKKVLGLELKMNGGEKINEVRFEIG